MPRPERCAPGFDIGLLGASAAAEPSPLCPPGAVYGRYLGDTQGMPTAASCNTRVRSSSA